jgi:beta-xylosidase
LAVFRQLLERNQDAAHRSQDRHAIGPGPSTVCSRYPTPRQSCRPASGFAGALASDRSSFLVHQGRFYYLFASFDLCCRGTKSTYKTMIGRSRKVTGPYLDAQGTAMLEGGGTPLLVGNPRWVGPGGESVLQQKGGDNIVFPAYDAQTGRPFLQISSLAWVKGWPQAALDQDSQSKGP